MDQDKEHLRLLSIFHYVVAGIAALFAMFPLIHLFMGLAMFSGAMHSGHDDGPLTFIALIFTVLPLMLIFLGLTGAAMLVKAGRNLQNREQHTFCLVIAGLCCMFAPFGTVLGVFTIIVLIRPSVKELFEGAPSESSESHSY